MVNRIEDKAAKVDDNTKKESDRVDQHELFSCADELDLQEFDLATEVDNGDDEHDRREHLVEWLEGEDEPEGRQLRIVVQIERFCRVVIEENQAENRPRRHLQVEVDVRGPQDSPIALLHLLHLRLVGV